jgi:hypothetical protein
MSDADPVDTPPQPAAKEIRTEGHALVQVEKWMAMIRELGANPRRGMARCRPSADAS